MMHCLLSYVLLSSVVVTDGDVISDLHLVHAWTVGNESYLLLQIDKSRRGAVAPLHSLGYLLSVSHTGPDRLVLKGLYGPVWNSELGVRGFNPSAPDDSRYAHIQLSRAGLYRYQYDNRKVVVCERLGINELAGGWRKFSETDSALANRIHKAALRARQDANEHEASIPGVLVLDYSTAEIVVEPGLEIVRDKWFVDVFRDLSRERRGFFRSHVVNRRNHIECFPGDGEGLFQYGSIQLSRDKQYLRFERPSIRPTVVDWPFNTPPGAAERFEHQKGTALLADESVFLDPPTKDGRTWSFYEPGRVKTELRLPSQDLEVYQGHLTYDPTLGAVYFWKQDLMKDAIEWIRWNVSQAEARVDAISLKDVFDFGSIDLKPRLAVTPIMPN